MKFLGARPQHEDLKLLVEDSDAVENNLAKFDSSGNPVDSGIASNTVPIATTANLTYYVNPSTGSDENDGSSGSPFATIAKAISLIPQIVNHTVTINLADGSYSEGITLEGYVGRGSIIITGNTTTPENIALTGQILGIGCACNVTVEGFDTSYTSGHAIYIQNCIRFFVRYVVADDSDGTNSGIAAVYSLVRVANCTFSNKLRGIYSATCSVVLSENNSGSNNTIGIAAIVAGTIGKNGTQPAGTTAESAVAGGEIR